jgi:glutathione S-transferase
MHKLTLTYFDFPGGRGEASRLALHIAGVDWTDNRVKRDDWTALKPTTPFGGLPTLEVQGQGVLSQSNAILSYIGRQYGLMPFDPFEAARHVAVMNAVEELRAQANATGRKDEEKKRAAREAFAAGYFARWTGHLTRQIRGPFIGGDELSVADLKVYVAMHSYREGVYDHIPANVLDPFPAIASLMQDVDVYPGVAEWRC